MALSPNYNWPEPDDSSLVKNGAEDIRALGDAIDTSMTDLLGGTTGQVLAKASDADMDFIWSADAAGMTNPMTTTGDTIYSSSGSTPARLGIGSTGNVLTVAGGVPTWAAPAGGGGMTLLASGSLSGSAVNLTSISGSYVDLKLYIYNPRPTTDNNSVFLRFNNDANTRYYVGGAVSSGTFNTTRIELNLGADNTTAQGLIVVEVPAYANATTWKYASSINLVNNASTPANVNFDPRNGLYNQTDAITELNLLSSSGTFASGTYALYGVK